MSGVLLDVNVPIALIDRNHVQHGLARDGFAGLGKSAWATCPLVENAVLRIIGNLRYPGSPGTPAAMVPSLESLRETSGHVFRTDDLSLLDGKRVDSTRLLNSGQVTDTYLLALARSKRGKLATFDRRLVTDAVIDGVIDGIKRALSLIE